jgi:hypothetical protein
VCALAQGVLGDEHLQLADDVGVPAGREIGVEPALERRQSQLLQAGDRRARERLVGQVGERRPAPQGERLAQRGRGSPRLRLGGLGEQALEPRDVDLGGVGAQRVARLARDDPVLAQLAAQARHVDVDALGDGRRRRLAPQLVDQALGGDHLVRVQQEDGEQRALLRAAEHERASVLDHLQRAKKPKFHVLRRPYHGRVYPSPPSASTAAAEAASRSTGSKRSPPRRNTMRRHRLTRAVALRLAFAAIAAPAAVAQQDLRSPDARDAARAALGPTQDLRSPDTRDVAVGYAPATAHAPVAMQPGGSEWRIGAAFALLAVVLASAAVTQRRRRTGGRMVAALAEGTRDWRRGVGL